MGSTCPAWRFLLSFSFLLLPHSSLDSASQDSAATRQLVTQACLGPSPPSALASSHRARWTSTSPTSTPAVLPPPTTLLSPPSSSPLPARPSLLLPRSKAQRPSPELQPRRHSPPSSRTAVDLPSPALSVRGRRAGKRACFRQRSRGVLLSRRTRSLLSRRTSRPSPSQLHLLYFGRSLFSLEFLRRGRRVRVRCPICLSVAVVREGGRRGGTGM